MNDLIAVINDISQKAKNQFKPDLKKYGKNFRAISESAVLEILNPLFNDYSIAYDLFITKSDLRVEKINAGTDVDGNIIQRLVFIAECRVSLTIKALGSEQVLIFEGWGSGVDSGDKATGKALTAAVKYALFKGFRLQYSDDPDADASEEIDNLLPVENKPAKAKEEKKKETVYVSAGQLAYIKGLCGACHLSDEDFKKEFKYFPYDEKMPMEKARAAIEALKKRADDLPF